MNLHESKLFKVTVSRLIVIFLVENMKKDN
jgi:hypothetical protein